MMRAAVAAGLLSVACQATAPLEGCETVGDLRPGWTGTLADAIVDVEGGGPFLAVADGSPSVTLYRVDEPGGNPREATSFEHDAAVTALAMSSSGQWLVTGTETGTLTLWHVSSRDLVVDVHPEGKPIRSLDVADDVDVIVGADSEGRALLWHRALREVVLLDTSLDPGASAGLSAGTPVFAGSAMGRAHLELRFPPAWLAEEVGDPELVGIGPLTALTSDDTTVYVAGDEGLARVRADGPLELEVTDVEPPLRPIADLVTTADGVVAAADHAGVTLYRGSGLRPLWEDDHTGAAMVTVTGNAKTLLAASRAGQASTWTCRVE